MSRNNNGNEWNKSIFCYLLSLTSVAFSSRILTLQEELSKDLRNLLDSESKRGDAAELALQEAKIRIQRQDKELADNREQMTAAAVQLAALEAALQEKMDQVQALNGLIRTLMTT